MNTEGIYLKMKHRNIKVKYIVPSVAVKTVTMAAKIKAEGRYKKIKINTARR